MRKMMAVSLLILTYEVQVLLGSGGMNCVGKAWFRDVALLKLIGDTTRQLQAGFCERGHGNKQKPLDKNVLVDAVEKLTTQKLETILNTSIQRLATKGNFAESQGHFTLDGTDLETNARYRDTGMKTATEQHWSGKEKKMVEIEKLVYGFKLLALCAVHLRSNSVSEKRCPKPTQKGEKVLIFGHRRVAPHVRRTKNRPVDQENQDRGKQISRPTDW